MSNQMQYKGYYGSIEASTEDNCLYGKLLFIRPLSVTKARLSPNLKLRFMRR